MRPHIVWFGEMPIGMDDIYRALAKVDSLISIGTSGTVYPAAGFVQEARLQRADTIEFNLTPSNVGARLPGSITAQPVRSFPIISLDCSRTLNKTERTKA